MRKIVGAIDSGTSSTRFMLFDENGVVLAADQREHRQIFPRSGWVEHDPRQIWERTREVIGAAMASAEIDAPALAAVGITNQRETAIVWDKRTGEPVYNAIVWQDTRTADFCHALDEQGYTELFYTRTGLRLATYFSGPKIRWILDNVEGARGTRRGGRIDLWHGRFLAHLEPDR